MQKLKPISTRPRRSDTRRPRALVTKFEYHSGALAKRASPESRAENSAYAVLDSESAASRRPGMTAENFAACSSISLASQPLYRPDSVSQRLALDSLSVAAARMSAFS